MPIRPTQKPLAVNFFDFEFTAVTVEIMDCFHAGLLSAVGRDRKSSVTMTISPPLPAAACIHNPILKKNMA